AEEERSELMPGQVGRRVVWPSLLHVLSEPADAGAVGGERLVLFFGVSLRPLIVGDNLGIGLQGVSGRCRCPARLRIIVSQIFTDNRCPEQVALIEISVSKHGTDIDEVARGRLVVG